MADLNMVVDEYIAAWNAIDAAERRGLVARVFADDATYLDPMLEGTGTDGIDAMIAAAQAQFAGARFELAGPPDAHHDVVRFSWHLCGPDGAKIVTGHDFAQVADDGRLRAVIGFLDQ